VSNLRALFAEKDRRRHAADKVAFACEVGRVVGIETCDPWQEEFLRSETDTLLCCSRQAGKSTIVGIDVAHDVLFKRGLVLVVSPTLRQSLEFLETVSTVVHAAPYCPELVEDNKLSLRTSYSRVVALPGVADNVRGFKGPRRLVFDEAAFTPDKVYGAVRPMRMASKARIDLLSTPFGKRGFFYQEWENGKGWRRQKVTALDVPRFNREMLEEERNNPVTGGWLFEQEYMCKFVDAIDSVFTHEQVMGALDENVEPWFPMQEAA
jgi:hypothetical protein